MVGGEREGGETGRGVRVRRFAVGDSESVGGTEETGVRNLKFEIEGSRQAEEQASSQASTAYACKKPGLSGQGQLLLHYCHWLLTNHSNKYKNAPD